MHAAADRTEAVENGNASGIGKEVWEGDPAAIGLDFELPAGLASETGGALGEPTSEGPRVDRRDALAGVELNLDFKIPSDLVRQRSQCLAETSFVLASKKADLSFSERAIGHDIQLVGASEDPLAQGGAPCLWIEGAERLKL